MSAGKCVNNAAMASPDEPPIHATDIVSDAPALPPDPLQPRLTLRNVVHIVAMNGFPSEVARCVDVCRDMRANVELWNRVVDLPRVVAGAVDESVFGPGARHRTPLAHWSEVGDVERVRAALDRGADVNSHGIFSGGKSALHLATAGGHAFVVRELLTRGAGVGRDPAGWSAMATAAFYGSTTVVRELVARGIDVDESTVGGMTPLMIACLHGHAATAAELLRLGADVNAQNFNGGTSALMLAASVRQADAVRVLLGVPGIDINLVDAGGRTALATSRPVTMFPDNSAVIALLEAAGAR